MVVKAGDELDLPGLVNFARSCAMYLVLVLTKNQNFIQNNPRITSISVLRSYPSRCSPNISASPVGSRVFLKRVSLGHLEAPSTAILPEILQDKLRIMLHISKMAREKHGPSSLGIYRLSTGWSGGFHVSFQGHYGPLKRMASLLHLQMYLDQIYF